MLQLVINDHKVKWLNDTTIRVGAMTISSPMLEELMEMSPLWPAHQPYLDKILTMAKKSS